MGYVFEVSFPMHDSGTPKISSRRDLSKRTESEFEM